MLALVGLSRPELDGRLRDAAQAMPANGDLAMVIVGPVPARGDELFLVPADAMEGLPASSPGLDTEALRLNSILRRFDATGLRELVVVVEDCRTRGEPCPLAGVRPSPKTSLLGQVAPRAARDAFRPSVQAAMMKPGQPFSAFASSLQGQRMIQGSSIAVPQPASTRFMFRPPDFFETASHPCLAIDPAARADTVRSASIRPLVAACESAVARWPSVDVFSQRLMAGQEQVAFQTAVAACARMAATDAYIATYPQGRYRAEVDAFVAGCRPAPPALPPPPPMPAVKPGPKVNMTPVPLPNVKPRLEPRQRAEQPKPKPAATAKRGFTCDVICTNLLKGRGFEIPSKAPGTVYDRCIQRLVSRGTTC